MKRYSYLLVGVFLGSLLFPVQVQGNDITITNPLRYQSFTELIFNIINFIFYLAIPVTALIIVFAAFVLLTSAGDPAKVTQAKNIIFWAIVGLIIIYLSIAILDLIKNALGIT